MQDAGFDEVLVRELEELERIYSRVATANPPKPQRRLKSALREEMEALQSELGIRTILRLKREISLHQLNADESEIQYRFAYT